MQLVRSQRRTAGLSRRPNGVKHAKDLQATAVKALAAAKAHDKDGLLDVGEAIDSACESCHVLYWYPDEKKPK